MNETKRFFLFFSSRHDRKKVINVFIIWLSKARRLMRSEIMRIYSALISQTKINTGDISLAIQNNLRNVIIIVHSRLMTAMC